MHLLFDACTGALISEYCCLLPRAANRVIFELAHAYFWEESVSSLLSEDKMYSDITLDQNREAVPAGLGGLLLLLS